MCGRRAQPATASTREQWLRCSSYRSDGMLQQPSGGSPAVEEAQGRAGLALGVGRGGTHGGAARRAAGRATPRRASTAAAARVWQGGCIVAGRGRTELPPPMLSGPRALAAAPSMARQAVGPGEAELARTPPPEGDIARAERGRGRGATPPGRSRAATGVEQRARASEGGRSSSVDARRGGGRGARRGGEVAARGGGRGPAAGSGMLGEDGREGKNGIKKL